MFCTNYGSNVSGLICSENVSLKRSLCSPAHAQRPDYRGGMNIIPTVINPRTCYWWGWDWWVAKASKTTMIHPHSTPLTPILCPAAWASSVSLYRSGTTRLCRLHYRYRHSACWSWTNRARAVSDCLQALPVLEAALCSPKDARINACAREITVQKAIHSHTRFSECTKISSCLIPYW